MNKRGFTIVETLIAVAILLLLVAGPLTLAERSLASSDAARQEVTAVYLAQEGLEYVRNVRDTNVLAGTADWLAGVRDCVGADCGIDPTADADGQVIDCTSETTDDCVLAIHNGLYGYAGGHSGQNGWETKSEYKRKVTITESSNPLVATVTATVSWTSGGFGGRSISVSTNLMKWYVAP